MFCEEEKEEMSEARSLRITLLSELTTVAVAVVCAFSAYVRLVYIGYPFFGGINTKKILPEFMKLLLNT